MTPLDVVLLICTTVALGISVVTLILVFARTRSNVDVHDLRSHVLALDQGLTDINDRVGQWMRRESVRRMREGKERKLEDEIDGTIPDRGTPEYKLYLRRLGLNRKGKKGAEA